MVTREQVMDVLSTCYDPEIPCNIVDLGLIYDVTIDPIPAGSAPRVSASGASSVGVSDSDPAPQVPASPTPAGSAPPAPQVPASPTPADPDKFRVHVKMTLTAPGCPEGPMMQTTTQAKLAAMDGVGAAQVELVWEPQWTPDRMSEVARLELGMA